MRNGCACRGFFYCPRAPSAAGRGEAARGILPYELSPNLLLTLSDHIAFALERQRKGIYIPMPLAGGKEGNLLYLAEKAR